MKRYLAFAALVALCATPFSRAEIGIGDSRDDVLRQVAKPTSVARRGDHEIFLYPKGGRIELIGGKVADVKGPLPPPPAEIPARTASDPTPVSAAATSATAAPAPALVTPPKPAASVTKSPVTRSSGASASAANALAKHVEKMDTAWGETPPPDDPHSPFESLPSFLTGLVLRLAFTVIALKVAFKYWEMDAFWSGIFTIASVDLVLHAGLEMLGPISGGFTTMGPVENGIPGLVLIYTIHRFCFNKRLQNAVVTAAAVKLVVTLCYIFAGVAALNAVFC